MAPGPAATPPPLLSSGAVVVRGGQRGHVYLLLRAYRNWDFSKGVVEAGEDPFDAAVREVEEETGLSDLDFRWGREFHETPPYGRGKVARYYVAATRTEAVALRPNPLSGIYEHHEFRWVTYAEARRLVVPRVQAALGWAESKIASAVALMPPSDDP
jgi:bis(5'-nucleosidyl)-tetraphosphatase